MFHNAYGPDKAWFRDPRLSGGGCVIDLGIHLVDLALWTLDFPRVRDVSSRLFAHGELLGAAPDVVEDYAVAQLDLAGGAVVRLACSWNLPAGRDAVIEATFHGTRGGAAMKNVAGSFYDFVGRALRRHAREPPGRAARRLGRPRRGAVGGRAGRRRPASIRTIERVVEVARVLDAIYGR